MKRILATLALLVWLVPSQGAEKNMITLDSLEEMFANIKAKTQWNTEGDLLWGYFFTDHNPKHFESLRKHLERNGYRYVDILEPEGGNDDAAYSLHVERVENHTPQSLYKRNLELYRLAEQYGVEAYDGMDVGDVDK